MANTTSLMGAAVAGTTVLSAWRTLRSSDSRLRQVRALLSLIVAATAVYGAIKAARNHEATLV